MSSAQRDDVEAEAVEVYVAALEVTSLLVAAVVVVVVPESCLEVFEKLVVQSNRYWKAAVLFRPDILLLVLFAYKDRPELNIS